MVKFIRMQNPISLDYIKDHLIPGEASDDKDSCCEILKNILIKNSKTAFFINVVEDDKIVAFLLGYIPHGVAYSVVFQFWSEEGAIKYLDTMLMRFLIWCEASEIYEVRMDDTRNNSDQQMKWGFKTCMTVRSLNVTEGLETKLKPSTEQGEL